MSISKPAVIAFSRDHDFVDMIEDSEFSSIRSSEKGIDYSFRNNTGDVTGLADHDAIVYDLDLADGNVSTAKEDMLHLKINSRSKPLIVIGQKKSIQELIATGSVSDLIDRNVAKPMVSSHLEMIVNTAISDYATKRPASAERKIKNPLFALVANIGSAMAIGSTKQV